MIHGIAIRHLDDLPDIAREQQIAIGIIATPAAAAQAVADRLLAAGIRSVLNFAPTVISVPDEALLRKVDLATELQILSFYQQRRQVSEDSDAPVEGVPAGVADGSPDGAATG